LTDRYLKGIPEDSRAASATGFLKSDRVTPQLVEVLQELNAVAAGRGQSLARLALTWILRDGRITSLLIGASRTQQIEDCVAAQHDDLLTAEELRRIETALAKLRPASPRPVAKPKSVKTAKAAVT
jgi:L-glyceraldehyde 3-phosphate reductase